MLFSRYFVSSWHRVWVSQTAIHTYYLGIQDPHAKLHTHKYSTRAYSYVLGKDLGMRLGEGLGMRLGEDWE